MLTKLQAYYGEHLTISTDRPQHYYWFVDQDGKRFGIAKSRVSSDELSLLNSLFTQGSAESPLSPRQLFWKNVLSGDHPEAETESSFRFIHFFLKNPLSDQEAFMEAVSGIFPLEVTVLFITSQYGVLIEPKPDEREELPYDQVKPVLTGDFYTDLDLFLGMWIRDYKEAPDQYHLERELFSSVRPFLPAQEVYSREDLVPYLLLTQLGKSALYFISQLIPEELYGDRDLIQSIKVYLECNMNLSMAAKKLYIHRNSLQYRVDKFIEKTGIDVKQFKPAMAVYQALISREGTSR
ncbi:PucR family transcriptional regulator [Fictibacillus terranigra]|uniref:Helix-turn-helix domain-containing protein n=1 Tax=Fictibacillus terranigra TaxID=3058424 RepID=A0ABT8ED25_9BACL|nr:helix-turn-helix domain-containing protein [Fictibacillus sp. CENA-BCM004]MDN4075762.1 helix-turn-helix domain-containing protein [Fictibacillus sp. CENA-BCM004]